MAGNKNSGARESYAWDQWFDGGKHELSRREHFPGASVRSFRRQVYVAAARHDVGATVNVCGDDVIIRAYRFRETEK